jgi:predicted Zn-dependent protease
LRKEEKYAESIAELRQAIELKPYSIASKTDLAALLRQTQEYDEAIDILNMILKEFPRDAHSRNELASCYREKYELDLARRILKDGLILVKNNNHFYTNLFIIHLFFSCEVDNALDIKKEYLNLTGEELIRDKMVRQKYDDFIHHFEAIHSGQADHELNGKYLEECISSKRAYQTAAKLLNKLLKTHPESFWYTRLRKELPPQYNAFFDL